MNLIQLCISRPVGVSVGVLLVVLFGGLALFAIPVQLTPNVDVTKVRVETRWPGATPQEVEREIIERQEEQLRSVKGLREMRSTCHDDSGEIELEFYNDVDRDAALRDVNEKLRQVSDYPEEVDEPTVAAQDSAANSPIAWLILYTKNGQDTETPKLRDFAEDFMKPYLDRVQGVASVDVYGGLEREVQVRVDAGRLAARGLTFRQLEEALRRQNQNTSAGTLAQGKRDYAVRTVAQYESTEEILRTIVADTPGGPVYVGDVADVEQTFKKQRAFVRSKGQFVLAMPVRREVGANVIEVMRGVKDAVKRINKEVLQARGMALELQQVYDETVYIDQAIRLVRDNIFVGGGLAAIVLLLFLKNWRATAVVALSIPISVIGTFLVLASTGRTINVISLAGMAFAVGMVVDNTIVVLENIYRHFQMGKTALQAAIEGTQEVWGAVLASTLTTMAVFIPVIFVREEAGQLFRDISIATATSVALSLVVSILVAPTLAARLLAGSKPAQAATSDDERLPWFSRWVARLTHGVIITRLPRLVLIGALTALSFALIPFFTPEQSYLPAGNRNLIFGFIVCPPGYSMDEFGQMGKVVEDPLQPYWEVSLNDPNDARRIAELDAAWAPRAEQLLQRRPPAKPRPWSIEERLQAYRQERDIRTPPPPIDNFFFVARQGGVFMGASSQQEKRVRPLANLMQWAGGQIPGVFPIFRQTSIFSIGGGNTVEVQVRGDDLDKVVRAAGALFGRCQFGAAPPRPTPNNFNLGRPELQILPDRERAAQLGLNARDVGFIVEACIDGAYVGDYRLAGGDTIDISLKVAGQDERPSQAIGQVPLYSPLGQIVPLASVARLIDTTALESIYRVERQRAVTLELTPSESVPLQSVISKINTEIVPDLRKSGDIPDDVIVSLTGNADKLVTARNVMVGEWHGWTLTSLLNIVSSRFFLALLITYLLMAALYESWVYPFVIMFSVPLALIGGFIGLTLCHWGTLLTVDQPVQQLDVVTFLGFVILVGIVVNNAILLVDQALRNVREHGLPHYEAIRLAVATRVRPIMMTSLTTVFGQLPLAVFPGAGSELYRGLAAVMVGGMLVSTLGTLVLVPSVLALVFDLQVWLSRVTGGVLRPAGVTREQ